MKRKRKQPGGIARVSPAAFERCAWCDKRIGEDDEVVTLPMKSRPDVDLRPHAGSTLQLPLKRDGSLCWVIVPTGDSEAKAQGYDMVLIFCSESCALEMRADLEVQGVPRKK